MEYADGGALRNYLKINYDRLAWEDKSNLAFQLASAVSFLHGEGVVHPDFGLSKRIDEATNHNQSNIFVVIPYVDPKRFGRKRKFVNKSQQYMLNEKSDVYSVGL
ncbi:7256_t:CDS:2 [Funneliformis geosporum]|nr:7256_t:CDS:2 [Funneliformis geosporum]